MNTFLYINKYLIEYFLKLNFISKNIYNGECSIKEVEKKTFKFK